MNPAVRHLGQHPNVGKPFTPVATRTLNQNTPRLQNTSIHSVSNVMETQPMLLPVAAPYMVVPYGNSYMYYPAQPYYYPYVSQPMRMYGNPAFYEVPQAQPSFSNTQTWKKEQIRKPYGENLMRRGSFAEGTFFSNVNPNFYYGSADEGVEPDEIDANSVGSKAADSMSVNEIHSMILEHLQAFPRVKLSWFNKLLVKVASPEDFNLAMNVLELFAQRQIEISPETGTLFIKAACRAQTPEKALDILKATDQVRLWPTLGGIHYLMINFSLKKDTKSVKETFEVAQKRQLKPNMRTYQIIIRECVDNNLIDDALHFVEQCENEGIIPNRVTYNILMNGLRIANRPLEIIAIRQKMDKHGLEINDTTVKFTSIAFMMLNDVSRAVVEFLAYPELKDKLIQFCDKFFEVAEDHNPVQNKCVVDLFEAILAKGTVLPGEVLDRVAQLRTAV